MDRNQIGGVLKVKPPERVDRITSFALYWALTSGVAGEAIAEIALDASAEFTLYTFPENTAIPAGTNGFLVYPKNQYGLSQEAAKLIFPDAARPLLKPTGLSLVDQDSTPHKVGGTLILSKAVSEDDISSYRVYWGDDQGIKVQATPLVSLAAMGTDLNHAVALDTDIPAGAVRLLAYAVNDYGEAADFLSYAFSDLTACVNPLHAGAACDQCVPGFSNYPACDQCSNPHVSGAACDQCAEGFANFPDCDTCANPDHAGPGFPRVTAVRTLCTRARAVINAPRPTGIFRPVTNVRTRAEADCFVRNALRDSPGKTATSAPIRGTPFRIATHAKRNLPRIPFQPATPVSSPI